MGDPGAQYQGGRLVARADIRVTHICELTAQNMLLFAPYVFGRFRPAPSRRFPLTLAVSVTAASRPTGSLAPRVQTHRMEHSLDCPMHLCPRQVDHQRPADLLTLSGRPAGGGRHLVYSSLPRRALGALPRPKREDELRLNRR